MVWMKRIGFDSNNFDSARDELDMFCVCIESFCMLEDYKEFAGIHVLRIECGKSLTQIVASPCSESCNMHTPIARWDTV